MTEAERWGQLRRLVGYTLVASREHREQVVGSFTVEEYVGLQRVVHRVAVAVQRAVEAERVYLLSLGSNQGNAHVHWHIAPLPAGVPYEEQQLAVFRQGVLQLPESERVGLIKRTREYLV